MLRHETTKPFAQSSEENKHVILQAIQSFLNDRSSVLEIGSGTGQHAVHFAEQMPHLSWQTSDLIESHNGIKQWISDANLNNVLPPLLLNVSENNWPTTSYDAIYSANSFHIMAKQNVQDFFSNVNNVLNQNGVVMIYGPFNYNGQYTSESNARFDGWLKQRNPASCIKDFEWCNQLAEMAGLTLLEDIEMPQNNRILVWTK
ncbi:DUF938 domain-containing protein [Hydrogenovibrio kuenenii]|uniref:DUF938 domain-containing protein n=1 Tax=Hydrogenovibrio kuenenii TaxID=63658 RepID=UPI0004648D66|nr:DUF938 domain-containing protein [Hydrogenovibrio kuenenii]